MTTFTNKIFLKRAGKIILRFFLILLILLGGIYLFFQTPFGQNWLVKRITKRLSRELNTRVQIENTRISFFNKLNLEGLLIEDRRADTLFYARQIQVRITDWFFLKKKAELKRIGLEHALIKIQRTDSVWNHQFLLDYFSKNGSGSGTKKQGIVFNLKKLALKDVRFEKKDAWLGKDLKLAVSGLSLDANALQFGSNTFDIELLILQRPEVRIRKYRGKQPLHFVTKKSGNTVSESAALNSQKTTFRISYLKTEGGIFSLDHEGKEARPYFDGKHIYVSNIEGEWKNARIIGDTVFALMKCSAKERSGFALKSMNALVKVTPRAVFLEQAEIKTNRSIIRDNITLSYDRFRDFNRFLEKVQLGVIFKNSLVHTDDIAFFAPKLASWKKTFTLNGVVRGTVNDLVANGLRAETEGGSLFQGKISLTGLPDIEKTFINLEAEQFRTTLAEAGKVFPALNKIKTPEVLALQYIQFRGKFTGFIKDFVTRGQLATALGRIGCDLNLKFSNENIPVYSGTVNTDNFNLGRFLNDKKAGNIAGKITFSGAGFFPSNRNIDLDAQLQYIDFNNYRYQNISAVGSVRKHLLEGSVSLRDPNADLTTNAKVEFLKGKTLLKANADIGFARLHKLRLFKDTIEIKGKGFIEAAAEGFENLAGVLRLNNAEIKHKNTLLPLDSLYLQSYTEKGTKYLKLASSQIQGEISGNYVFQEIPSLFSYFLHQYFPSVFRRPRFVNKNKNVQFEFEIFETSEWLGILHPLLANLNHSRISGFLNPASDKLFFSVEIPRFQLFQYYITDLSLRAKGEGGKLTLNGTSGYIQINDSLYIPKSDFSVLAKNDSSYIKFLAETNTGIERADLDVLVINYTDGIKIEFNPSAFTINGKLWAIDEFGEIVLRRNTPATGDLFLTDGQQKIKIKTQPSSIGNWNDIILDLENLNLADIVPYIAPRNRLEGLLTGTLLIEDPTGELKIISENLQIKMLRLDNDSLGEVVARAQYEHKDRKLTITGNTLNQQNYLDFNAGIYIDDKEKEKNNRIVLNTRRFEIKFLERFLGNLFSGIQGYLTGDIHISGPFQNLTVTGKGKLTDAGLRINFTQCFYKIQDKDIELTSDEIRLDGLVLIDTVTGNPVYVSGGIEHSSFKNMFYNIHISTRKPGTRDAGNNRPVQLLNTTYLDNQQFYGQVKGTGSLSLLGPQSNMFMKVDLIASETDSSFITLPPSVARETGMADFLVERKYGREMTAKDVKSGQSNIIYDVDVTVNKTAIPMVTVRVILDELTGDEIKAKGYGSLNIRSGTAEPLTLRGRFDIEEGNYLFTFQSFFKKPFELRKGSGSYIEWNGDPYDANIRFEAIYRAERVNFAPLAELLRISNTAYLARGDVFVVTSLSDKLFRPSIRFSLDFPSSSVAVNDPELALVLQQIQRNPNEMNRQVTYLIVFNSFAPVASSASSTSSTLNEFVYSSISSVLFTEISKVINSLFSKIFNTDNIAVNISGSLYNRNLLQSGLNFSPNQGQLDVNIPISFFEGRFQVRVGSTFDLALDGGPAVQEALRILPDVTMEWIINKSGTIRASFFYRENADYLATATFGTPNKARRIGGNISYTKEFEKLKDLFRSGKAYKKNN
ncbi:MAG: translocation/assembly module TamB [Chitinophagaceae bacterium]|nr:translocation/assembly module TamB [Chitinophagaceae bacterium]